MRQPHRGQRPAAASRQRQLLVAWGWGWGWYNRVIREGGRPVVGLRVIDTVMSRGGGPGLECRRVVGKAIRPRHGAGKVGNCGTRWRGWTMCWKSRGYRDCANITAPRYINQATPPLGTLNVFIPQVLLVVLHTISRVLYTTGVSTYRTLILS